MNELVVLKIGGSVATRKKEGRAEIDPGNLSRISSEISGALKKKDYRMVAVHGAGPFGHNPVKKYGLDTGFSDSTQLAGLVETRKSMEGLNYRVVESLVNAGVNAIAFQPSACGLLSDGRILDFQVRLIEGFLSLGVVPVGYGDLLLDEKRGVSVLSGDYLAPYLALRLKARRVVVAADVKGIYSSDPKSDPDADFIPELTSRDLDSLRLAGSRSTDVTGGMKGKIEALMEAASKGVEVQVVSGLEHGFVEKALLGEHVGTFIKK
ncbi:MAG: isopentenyl phosphate kinase [Candidatus Altiarchaeota archaeon]|nr:isopentenyl phosphate kinase [Candidatus Altiarchaeota archaeon]